SGSGGGTFANKTLVLNFLDKESGNHTAIGVEDKAGGDADSVYMAGMADDGKSPSYWGGDFGFGTAASASSRAALMQEAITQWNSGSLVALMYHACPLSWGSNETGCAWDTGTDPVDGSFGDLTAADWVEITTPGTALYNTWIARLNTLAPYFQTLQAAGVAPLFRPFHEINGNWAWWQGETGANGSAKLYQITHDYLTNTKGLTNIIWVWNTEDYSTLASDVVSYSPGSSYFDVATVDVYITGYTTGVYDDITGASGGKLVGISECQFLPTPSTLSSQPKWVYVAVWPDFFYSPYQTDNSTLVPELFGDSQVLTLSNMPGW
ncbi:MAG: glycosyl hydrolase, partial [Terracidiphilus sp.]